MAGLGNPGAEYEATRHNVGFVAVDQLATQLHARLKRSMRHRAMMAEAHLDQVPIVLAKAQTFVNDSGTAIAALSAYFRVPAERTIVVYDELELEFAKLRVRQGGGTAGHNGLKSIVAAIGAEFVRIRIGIGRPPGRMEPADYVLSAFSKREADEIAITLHTAVEAALTVIRDGVETAQNLFN
ncbi:MAG: aminoacyl-tRNA hydrolase [Actinomycetota bacterium]